MVVRVRIAHAGLVRPGARNLMVIKNILTAGKRERERGEQAGCGGRVERRRPALGLALSPSRAPPCAALATPCRLLLPPAGPQTSSSPPTHPQKLTTRLAHVPVSHSSISPSSRAAASTAPSRRAAAATTGEGDQGTNRTRCRATRPSAAGSAPASVVAPPREAGGPAPRAALAAREAVAGIGAAEWGERLAFLLLFARECVTCA